MSEKRMIKRDKPTKLPVPEQVKATIGLMSLDSSDVDQLRQWRNDARIWRWCRQSDFISDVAQKRWFESQDGDPTIHMYKIVAATDKAIVMVGACGLTSIDWMNRRAEFSIYIAPDFQKQGMGCLALRSLLLHAFQNLGLDQIWGESFEGNPGIKMFESLGFKKDGTRRAFYFKDGTFHDAHLYSILRSEWTAQQQVSSAS